MKTLPFVLLFFSISVLAQKTTLEEDKKAIETVLRTQQEAWNNYDIETFMETYWKSKDLKFYGAGGVVKGWQSTLDRYKKSYPTRAHFGTLNFVLHDISRINEGAYSVMGEFYLTREVGDAKGIFMLILKKMDGAWKIITDTSAAVN